MSLTYLDSVMIQIPAAIATLSTQNLTADNLTVTNLDVNDLDVNSIDANNLDVNSIDVSSITSFNLTNNGLAYLNTAQVASLQANQTLFNTSNIINATLGTATATNILALTGTTNDLYVDRVHKNIGNVLYVTASGSDTNSGTNIFNSLKTIKKACEIAHNQRVANFNSPNIRYTIFVSSGDYYEQNPIYVPSNVSIIGDNLRRTNIRPLNSQYDILWVDNSSYVWGFTFRGHLAPAAAVAFPNYSVPALTSVALSNLSTPYVSPNVYKWRKPYITTSPYIQGSSSITTGFSGISAGCGMRVDGSLAEGFLRSMVLDSYTQFNESGKGIHIINNGYAQLVSIFTICCTEGIHCESGGVCSISNSNCSFGLSGVVASGKSPMPVLTGTVIDTITAPGETTTTRVVVMSGIEGTLIYPNSDYYPALLSVPGINIDTRKIAYAPYDNLIFTLQNDPIPNSLYTITGAPTLTSINSQPCYIIEIIERTPVTTFTTGNSAAFYIRSTAYASSHTFEFIGTGVSLRQAVPALGGVPTPDTEVAFDGGGAVFYTSTNHTGDFSIGKEFKVVQSTGTIEGDTFKRSILTLVSPLNLAIAD